MQLIYVPVTSKLFGLIVPSIANQFYNSFVASVEEECRRNGYSLMILQSGDDPSIELTNLKLCRQNRITGLFVCISPETVNIEPFLKLKKLRCRLYFSTKCLITIFAIRFVLPIRFLLQWPQLPSVIKKEKGTSVFWQP